MMNRTVRGQRTRTEELVSLLLILLLWLARFQCAIRTNFSRLGLVGWRGYERTEERQGALLHTFASGACPSLAPCSSVEGRTSQLGAWYDSIMTYQDLDTNQLPTHLVAHLMLPLLLTR